MQGCLSAFGNINEVELCEGLQQLKSEHPPLLEKLDELFKLTENITKEINIEASFSELVTKVIIFKSEIEPHSEREEGVLFSLMEKYIGRSMGPIAVMEYEHDQAKSHIANFLNKTQLEMSLTNEEKKQSATLIRNAYFILTEHFSKEENILFPMAEQMLTTEEKLQLKERINEI